VVPTEQNIITTTTTTTTMMMMMPIYNQYIQILPPLPPPLHGNHGYQSSIFSRNVWHFLLVSPSSSPQS